MQNFSKIWGIETNFGQNRCWIMWKFTLSERRFNKLSYFLYFMKKSCLVLKLCHLKVHNARIPLKNNQPTVPNWYDRYLGSIWNLVVNRFLNIVLTGLLIFRSYENAILKMAKHSLAMPRYNFLKLTISDYAIRYHLAWNFLWF